MKVLPDDQVSDIIDKIDEGSLTDDEIIDEIKKFGSAQILDESNRHDLIVAFLHEVDNHRWIYKLIPMYAEPYSEDFEDKTLMHHFVQDKMPKTSQS